MGLKMTILNKFNNYFCQIQSAASEYYTKLPPMGNGIKSSFLFSGGISLILSCNLPMALSAGVFGGLVSAVDSVASVALREYGYGKLNAPQEISKRSIIILTVSLLLNKWITLSQVVKNIALQGIHVFVLRGNSFAQTPNRSYSCVLV